mgnify:FL=1
MKQYKFKDTSRTIYQIEADNIEQAEKIFDTLWLHKQHSIDDICTQYNIHRTQNIWIEYKSEDL